MTDEPMQEQQENGTESLVSEGGQETSQQEAELNQMKDQLLRTLAEMENAKKRWEKEIQDMAKYAVSEFAHDLLQVSDNLGRALDCVRGDMHDQEGPIRQVLEGVKMTEKELLKTFEKHGIEKLVPLGEKFDHHFHQAIFETDHEGDEPGTVTTVVQPGYRIHDRLLRPALVGVAKAS